MPTRRQWIFAAAATVSTGAITSALASGAFQRRPVAAAAAEVFEVTHTEAEWRKKLSPQQYAILREESTERPGSSPLNQEHGTGTFACAGCNLPLFSSTTKYESGTGWPSFYKPLDQAIGTREARDFGMVRTEVHCRRCGGHLGHVFDDGPKPTGLRYCMNGGAMTFESQAA